MSHDELYEIFNDLLPTIKGKTVLDVGSRLGAVLYGVITIIFFLIYYYIFSSTLQVS